LVYVVDQLLALLWRTGHKPVKIPEWDLGLTSREANDIKEVFALVEDLKKRGVTGAQSLGHFAGD
jgi:hypothetical protein